MSSSRDLTTEKKNKTSALIDKDAFKEKAAIDAFISFVLQGQKTYDNRQSILDGGKAMRDGADKMVVMLTTLLYSFLRKETNDGKRLMINLHHEARYIYRALIKLEETNLGEAKLQLFVNMKFREAYAKMFDIQNKTGQQHVIKSRFGLFYTTSDKKVSQGNCENHEEIPLADTFTFRQGWEHRNLYLLNPSQFFSLLALLQKLDTSEKDEAKIILKKISAATLVLNTLDDLSDSNFIETFILAAGWYRHFNKHITTFLTPKNNDKFTVETRLPWYNATSTLIFYTDNLLENTYNALSIILNHMDKAQLNTWFKQTYKNDNWEICRLSDLEKHAKNSDISKEISAARVASIRFLKTVATIFSKWNGKDDEIKLPSSLVALVTNAFVHQLKDIQSEERKKQKKLDREAKKLADAEERQEANRNEKLDEMPSFRKKGRNSSLFSSSDSSGEDMPLRKEGKEEISSDEENEDAMEISETPPMSRRKQIN